MRVSSDCSVMDKPLLVTREKQFYKNNQHQNYFKCLTGTQATRTSLEIFGISECPPARIFSLGHVHWGSQSSRSHCLTSSYPANGGRASILTSSLTPKHMLLASFVIAGPICPDFPFLFTSGSKILLQPGRHVTPVPCSRVKRILRR